MIKVQSPKSKVQNLIKVKFSVFNSSLITRHSLIAAFYSLLFTASTVFASGGEGGKEHSVFDAYLWPVINFFVLVAILYYGLKKADIKGYFKKRTELIEKSLQEAREAKELARKALAEVEERLKVKDKEIEEIISSARQSGEKEKAHLIEEGDKLKLKILEQAKTNIDYELKRAKEEIKEEAVEIAMELAEKKLRQKLTKEEQLKLLEESLSKIEGKN
ncbi:MAG: ATP synthase F0 subunit B [Nitrospirota bacterium]